MKCRFHDPVFEDAEGWFFWDETWSFTYGPFSTEEAARRQLQDYVKTLDGHQKET